MGVRVSAALGTVGQAIVLGGLSTPSRGARTPAHALLRAAQSLYSTLLCLGRQASAKLPTLYAPMRAPQAIACHRGHPIARCGTLRDRRSFDATPQVAP